MRKILPDNLPPVVMRLGEGPRVTLISAEDRSWRDLKAWRFLVGLVGNGYYCVVWWAVDGCRRDERDKAMMYLRKRAKVSDVRRLEVFDVVRPVTVEIRRELEEFNRKLDNERRTHGPATERRSNLGRREPPKTPRLCAEDQRQMPLGLPPTV